MNCVKDDSISASLTVVKEINYCKSKKVKSFFFIRMKGEEWNEERGITNLGQMEEC